MIFLAQLLATIRRRPLITAAFVLALCFGGYNYRLWQERTQATQRHDEVRLRGETMLAALTNRARINDDLAALAEAQDVIDRNLVREEGMEVNLGYFYRLEKANRVRLVRIDQLVASPPVTGNPFKAVPVSLQVTGPYRNILGFLRELETGPRLLRIRSFRFERTDPGSGELALQLTVELLARA